MVDRHYSLNLKPWSARTLFVCAHADLAQTYSVGLQEIFVSTLYSQEENYFFLPCQWPHFHVVIRHISSCFMHNRFKDKLMTGLKESRSKKHSCARNMGIYHSCALAML